MKAQVHGLPIHVDFKHLGPYDLWILRKRQAARVPVNAKGGTEAKITMADNQVLMGTGYAWCHVRDQYVKEVGRKIALARALKDASFEKDERREVWKVYLEGRIFGT